MGGFGSPKPENRRKLLNRPIKTRYLATFVDVSLANIFFFLNTIFFPVKSSLNPTRISFPLSPQLVPLLSLSVPWREKEQKTNKKPHPILMLNENQKEQPYVIYFSGIEQELFAFLRKLFWFKLKNTSKDTLHQMYIFHDKKKVHT